MSAFYKGLSEIFELAESEVTPDFDLTAHNWDSLAKVSTIALIDEVYGEMVDGSALGRCVTVADLDALVAKTKE